MRMTTEPAMETEKASFPIADARPLIGSHNPIIEWLLQYSDCSAESVI